VVSGAKSRLIVAYAWQAFAAMIGSIMKFSGGGFDACESKKA
jgi:hypothetical protein